MRENENIYFLTGDLGYNAIEEIEKEFPKRFIDVGVAEQNMIGIASGLALLGKKVYIYSIVPFVTTRCYEQIRNDICYHDLDVTILGIGGGMSYGILSSTHFALEDIAILRPLPNMAIFSPADETEAVLCTKFLKNYHHPVYLRVGRKVEPTVYDKPYDFKFGKGVILKKGKDTTIFASGPIISEVLGAAKILKDIDAGVVNIHTIKPIDKELIIKQSKGKKTVFTVEEHGVIGGLGAAVSEIISEFIPGTKVIRIGTPDRFIKEVGSQAYLRKIYNLDVEGLVANIKSKIKN